MLKDGVLCIKLQDRVNSTIYLRFLCVEFICNLNEIFIYLMYQRNSWFVHIPRASVPLSSDDQ